MLTNRVWSTREAEVEPVQRKPTRMREIGNESRERILDAAEELFVSRGVAQTSFAAIQKVAGISRGSIPWHFRNKLGLLLAIVDRAMLLTDFDTSDLSGEEGVREFFIRVRERLHQPQAVLLAALLSESFRTNSETHDRYRNWHADARRSLADLVNRSADELKVPAAVRPDVFASILFGAVIGLHLQWRLAPDLVDLDTCLDALEELTLKTLDGDRRPLGSESSEEPPST